MGLEQFRQYQHDQILGKYQRGVNAQHTIQGDLRFANDVLGVIQGIEHTLRGIKKFLSFLRQIKNLRCSK